MVFLSVELHLTILFLNLNKLGRGDGSFKLSMGIYEFECKFGGLLLNGHQKSINYAISHYIRDSTENTHTFC